MKIRTVVAIIGCLLLSSCSTQNTPSETSAKALVDGFRYVKDKHGICYAIVQNLSMQGGNYSAFTSVPCEKVGL